jgi:uncharacterized protein (TIGR02246 family)
MEFPVRFVRLASIAVLVLFLSLDTIPASAQTPAPGDEAAITQVGKAWQDAWNSRDSHALASLLAEDADFVTVLGPNGWLKGRARFETVHAGMFPRLFSKSVWTTKETQVRFLRPDMAIAHVLWATTGDEVRHVKHGSPREGIFTWVLEKRNGQWLIVASQNTEVMPILPGQ